MRRTKVIQIGEPPRDVTFHELTVAEIRNWLASLEKSEEKAIDFISEGLMEEGSLSDIELMSDLSMKDLDQMAPSEIDALLALCRELNPRFFTLRNRLILASQAVAQAHLIS